MKVSELKALAKQKKIPKYYQMNKAKLVEVLKPKPIPKPIPIPKPKTITRPIPFPRTITRPIPFPRLPQSGIKSLK